MDRSEKKNKNRLSGKIPSVPIKTYKWEDLRRARRRGGYPWTYLYKEVFNESLHPEKFRMEGLKKNKATSASSASDSLEIKEITEEDVKGLEGLDSSYVVIESPILLGRHMDELVKEQETIIESADSSDNISQYLDREERGPEHTLESTETLTLPDDLKHGKKTERARSEEPKRKRRLSIDSNYSRVSLSKLGVMKRLKNIKERIKLPKFGEKIKKNNEKHIQHEEKVIEKPKNENRSDKPLYIHIPLKPREGETDEFSHLEFEEKETTKPQEVRIEISIDDIEEQNEESSSDKSDHTAKEVKLNDNNLGLIPPDDQEDDVSAIIFLEGEEGCENKGEYDIIAVDIDENSQEMKMSQVTNTEVRRQVLESIKKVESQPDISKNNEGSGVPLSRSSSRASKTSKSSIRKRRAKSAEPEKVRRGSIDSSYSRKSMSRIGLLKKLRSFHIPFLKSSSKRSINDNVPSSPKLETPKEIPKAEMKVDKREPLYIHIPLKPPEGQTDEFSHLEFDNAPSLQPKIEKSDTIESKDDDMSPIDTPQISKSPQFIILTPPSDDELLDKPELPETPSCEVGSTSQLEHLQKLARSAVDQINNTLEPVTEQSDEGSASIDNASVETNKYTESEVQESLQNKTKLTIDEEDGLKSIPQSNDEAISNLRSNLKNESSPFPKKKVSFKRRKSSQASQDDGYEEIESPPAKRDAGRTSEEISENIAGNSRSEENVTPSTNEVDSRSDIQMKTTSFEEMGGRWSKISDHEYEPVNPPPEEKTETTPLQAHVSEVLNPSSRLHEQSDDEVHQPELQSGVEFKDRKTLSIIKTEPSERSSRSRSREKEPAKPNKFQTAIKESATKFKTKLQGIKKPNISMPSRPKFQKPNFKKPNINLPKLPDISSTFRRSSKPDDKKGTGTKELEDSGSKKIFDFSTYPRIFSKKKRDHDSTSLKESDMEKPEKQARTVRHSGPAEVIRIPLHSEESMDQEHGIFPQPEEILEVSRIEKEKDPSPHQYQEDTEADDEDELQKERQEKHREAVAASLAAEDSRWNHGYFYTSQNDTEETKYEEDMEDELPQNYDLEQTQSEMVTDLDLDVPEETPSIPVRQKGRLQQEESFETNHSKDIGSSVSSLGQHRRGVLEEIDSDQFFLREKGISQDNIDMGKYLSTEIREAFRSPPNALADIHSYNYQDIRSSNQSLPETKRKPVKKPKRRKTPHTSQERLRYEPESENEDYNFMPPIRPKRKSRRKKRSEPDTDTIPYVQTIPLYSTEYAENPPADDQHHEYEDDQMEDEELPEPYHKQHLQVLDMHDAHRRASEPIPAAPPRKHKSLKSLNASEHDSIFEEYGREEYGRNEEKDAATPFDNKNVSLSSDIEEMKHQNHFETDHEPQPVPKPPTRSRSKTKSMSRTTSQADRDSILGRTDSIMFDEEFREPVVEEPCIKDLRDAMGYAIVDKNQNKNWEHKFCTVPRSQGGAKPPERPLRNYSTLGPSRPERKASKNMTDEEKENVDLSQYIEIEDERDLQSGEVIQKIQNRPLPAPPRPPRCKSKPLSDITSQSNLDLGDVGEEMKNQIDETEVSTQTEPLPSDFECEEMVHEETDKIMTPSPLRKNRLDQTSENDHNKENEIKIPTEHSYIEETITHGQLLVEPLNGARILSDSEISPRAPISVTSDEEETSEIPEYFKALEEKSQQPEKYSENVAKHPEGQKELSNDSETADSDMRNADSFISGKFDLQLSDQVNTNILPDNLVVQDTSETELFDEVNTSIPQENPIVQESSEKGPSAQTNEIDDIEPQRPPRTFSQKRDSFDVLRTQKLQVSDLDVDRLTVNELVATKIVVSEIDSGNITSNEISSKSGKLKLGDLELEPDVVKKILEQLKEASKEQLSASNIDARNPEVEEKKTSIDLCDLDTALSQDSTLVASNAEAYVNAPQSAIVNEEGTSDVTQNSKINQCDASLEISKSDQDEYINKADLQETSPHTTLASVSSSAVETNEDCPIEDTKIIIENTTGNIKNSSEKEDSDKAENTLVIDNKKDVEVDSVNEAPLRPPRFPEKKQIVNQLTPQKHVFECLDSHEERVSVIDDSPSSLQLLEPEVDDEPPPRPPQPQVPYFPSEPPAGFYNLRNQTYVEESSNDIPLIPRRHRPRTKSRSTSSESRNVRRSRRRIRSPEPSIPPEPSISHLTGQIVDACSIIARNKLKRLLDEINKQIPSDEDAESNKQNVQVIMVVLLILIAILLLVGYGDGRTVHLHHWEYFNPPTDT